MARGRYRQEQAVRDFKKRVRRNRRRRRLTLFILFCVSFYLLIFLAPFFKISESSIQITGTNKTEVQVKNYSRGLIGKNINWYSTDKMEETVLQFNYIKSARVSRHFPNRLRISVEEITPICQAKIGDIWHLIDDRGKAIDNSYENFNVAEARGLEGLEVGKLIPSEAKRANLAAICEQILNHELIGNVRNYDLTDDKNIKFRLDNIEVQLGDNSRMEYKFMMLMEIYEGLLPNIKGELDLRNGSKAYFKEIYQ